MNPLQFTRSVRSLNRLRRIAQVLTQHGFGYVVAQLHLARFVPVWMMRRRAHRTAVFEGPLSIGRRLTLVCTELGPTFVKLGQMLSTRPDVVPADILSELRTLQDEVPPFDTATAMEVIRAELGRPAGECFAWIDDRPMASGSIGQVYRARGHDESDLVVKIRRPDVDDVIRLDLQLLRWLAESLESVIPEMRMYRPRMIVEELDEMLTRELDYVHEASATARFARGFADDPTIQIPKVHWELCGPRVLTLGAISGVNVASLWEKADAASAAGRVDRRLVARRLADAFLKQVFELGAFHCDPHPGNVLIEPPAKVGLIDFGQVGTVSEPLRSDLIAVIYACVNRDVELVVDALADLGALGLETDRRALQRGLQSLLDKYHGLPLKRLDLNTLLAEFSDVVRRHDVIIPKEAVLLGKSLGMVAGLTGRLDPDLVLLDLLKSRLEQTLKQQFSAAKLGRGAAVAGWHLWSIARHVPSQIRETLRRVAGGAWRLNLRHENLDRLIHELDRSSNRLAFSIVIAAIIIGSSVVVSASTELTLFDIRLQYLGVVGYLIAGVLGLGLSWAIYRSGRLH
jgi:ubiquinone biosynthesis protein